MRLALITVSALAIATLPAVGSAECRLSGASILNPDDPECRDAMFRYVESASTNADEITLGYPVPIPVDSLTPIDGFRSYDSLKARHQELAIMLDTVESAVVGSTGRGEEILAYRLGDHDLTTVTGEPEPAVLINGTIHAREWQSPEVVTGIMESLAEIADDGGIGEYLADNLNVVILPVLNIDGFRQTQRYPDRFGADPDQPRDGRMRRKNMRHANGLVDTDLDNTADNFLGVDLNRNNLHGFGQNGGSSSDPISLVHHGLTIASEPEIAALQAAAALGPASQLRLFVDVHSFSQIYFTPLTGNARRDELSIELMQRMRAVTHFKYRDGRSSANAVGRDAIGTTADYFAYEYQIPSWTLELEPLNGAQEYGGTASHGHSGFILPDSEVDRMRTEQSETHLLGFYRQAGPPHVVAVELRSADDGRLVYRADWSGSGRRTLQVSANSALRPGASYRLWIAFNKPMRWRDRNGSIRAFPGQRAVDGGSTATLELSGQSAVSIPLAIDDPAVWRNAPGGAPDGFHRYRDDSLSVDFTVPASLDVTTVRTAHLVLDDADMSGQRLDADPATPVSWARGHWNGFENELGEDGDTGGLDCNISFFVAADPNANPPASPPTCKPSASVPDSDGGGGGGGGVALWLLPLLLLWSISATRRDF